MNKKQRFDVFLLLIFLMPFTRVYAQQEGQIDILQLEGVVDFALSPTQQNRMVVVDETGEMRVLDISGEILFFLETTPLTATFRNVSWSSNGQYILAAFDDKARVWDAETGLLLYEFGDHLIQPMDPSVFDFASGVDAIATSPSGVLFATSNRYDSTVALYETSSSEIVYELADHQAGDYLAGIEELIFSPDSSLLAVRQFVGGIAIWDTCTHEKRYQLPGEVIAFSHNGAMIATAAGRWSSRVWIWDSGTGNLLFEYAAPLVAEQLEWSLDDTKIFVSFTEGHLISDGFTYTGAAVRVWDLIIGEEMRDFALTEIQQLPLVLDANEELIAVGGYHAEGSVFIWNRATGDFHNEQLSSDTDLSDYSITTQSPALFDLNSDNRFLAVSYGYEIIIWDAQTVEQLQTLNTDDGIVRKIGWFTTQNALAVLFDDHTLTLWNIL